MSKTSKIAYAIAFQIGWFICIMTENTLAFTYTSIFLLTHFIFLKVNLHKVIWIKEILWLLIVLIGGTLLETLVFSAGFIYSISSHVFFNYIILPPLWLMSLWVLFGLALRTCLAFVFSAPKTTYLIATITIPLNYYAGTQLNSDVELNSPYTFSLTLISLLWILLLWLLIKVKHYYFEDIFNAR